MTRPPKIQYRTDFLDDTFGFPRFSHPVTKPDENIQDVPSSPFDRIDLRDIMKDIDTSMDILKSTEELDWVPQRFLEDDENDLFEEKENNQDKEGNKIYLNILFKCILIYILFYSNSA